MIPTVKRMITRCDEGKNIAVIHWTFLQRPSGDVYAIVTVAFDDVDGAEKTDESMVKA